MEDEEEGDSRGRDGGRLGLSSSHVLSVSSSSSSSSSGSEVGGGLGAGGGGGGSPRWIYYVVALALPYNSYSINLGGIPHVLRVISR